MKTNFFTKLALVIVTVAAVTTTFAQRWNNARRFANNQIVTTLPTCINQITNLTDKQITKITALEEKHQAKMDEFRTQRRSTFDLAEKNKLRAEMDKMVETHQNEVKSLLTEEQQKQYALLHTTANPHYAQGRQFYRAGNNQTFVRAVGRENCYATVGRRNWGGAGNNKNFVRGNGKGNYAMVNNAGFNCGRANRQRNVGTVGYGRGYGRNAAFCRGYGRGFNTIPTDTIKDSKEN
ncbi:MAG: hypothetical protein L3J11_12410 [Draconibacterium sp.]|nr:hypothetical protein [Draconibacterium sp.]